MSARYLCSSIGKKQLMALTGLGWCGFVLAHMLGNLLFLVGPEAYNNYGNNITGNKEFYYLAEAGLVAMLVIHVFAAMLVVVANRRARPIGYAVSPQTSPKTAATFASRTMALSGLLVLVFIVFHLITFRFGPEYPFPYKGQEIRDLHRLMVEVFQSAGYTAWYLVALSVLSLHLQHALWSSLQTMGWIPLGKEAGIRKLSYAFGILVSVGFALNPIYIFFLRGGR
jgi:succinate dehydrogenase / fumarate reductase cytochrome b subunit